MPVQQRIRGLLSATLDLMRRPRAAAPVAATRAADTAIPTDSLSQIRAGSLAPVSVSGNSGTGRLPNGDVVEIKLAKTADSAPVVGVAKLGDRVFFRIGRLTQEAASFAAGPWQVPPDRATVGGLCRNFRTASEPFAAFGDDVFRIGDPIGYVWS